MAHLVKELSKRWPGNCLIYEFHAAITNEEKDLVYKAMRAWESTEYVRFSKRDRHAKYVTFRPDPDPIDSISSSTEVGMGGGQQFINVDVNVSAGTLIHEIGHALGFHHEHKRFDRDPFIDVKTSKISDNHISQFEKIPAGDALRIDGYDLDSVMHYGAAKTLSKDGQTNIITTDDPDNQARIGARTSPSFRDGKGMKYFDSGNQLICRLSHDGQIENVVEKSDWSSGWSIACHYNAGLGGFMFFLKSRDGTMHVNKVRGDGSIGERLQTRDWSSGWTQAVSYEIWGTDYLLLYKIATGNIHIHRIENNGSIGDKVDGGHIEHDCIQMNFISVLGGNYLIMYLLNGHVMVYEIKSDGAIGPRKLDKNIGAGFTTITPYSAGIDSFLFCMKTGSGEVNIRKIEAGGQISDVIQTKDWSSGWTSAIPYSIGTGKYIFLMKSGTGDCHINKIEGNGMIGDRTDIRKFRSGWKTITIYKEGFGTYVQLVSP